MAVRNVIKEPLSYDELKKLSARVSSIADLVAPKRRAEAEGLSGDKLLRWLAQDGARLRRPIVIVGNKILLGFAKEAQAALIPLLK